MEHQTTVIAPAALRRQEEICQKIRDYWQAQGITPVAFVDTYGCQQNEADSERIRGMLETCGYGMASSEEGADVIILNTCAIREHAEQRVFGLSLIHIYLTLIRDAGIAADTQRQDTEQEIILTIRIPRQAG